MTQAILSVRKTSLAMAPGEKIAINDKTKKKK